MSLNRDFIVCHSVDTDQTAPQEQSDQGLHCLPYCLHLLNIFSLNKSSLHANFMITIAIILGVPSSTIYIVWQIAEQILSQLMRLWYLSHRLSPEPSLFPHIKYGSKGSVWPKSTSGITGWLRMWVWRMRLQRTKSTIISWDGSFKECRR